MNYSYWELKEWFSNIDFTIIGSGIVGLTCALELRKIHPKARILILEKGELPQGASTKNAGFACFGSVSELLDDLKNHSEENVFNLVAKRWQGLQLLRQNLGDKNINFQQNKGFELFENNEFYEMCVSKKDVLNKLLYPIFKNDVFTVTNNRFHFKNVHENYLVNNYEGQIDTGKMMHTLLQKAMKASIKIINGITVSSFEDINESVVIHTDKITFKTSKLCLATNGFTNLILNEKVTPARAQVLITKPIKNLAIKGTFHLDKGYFYFRNIDNRILLGGGRNLDFTAEETTEFGKTPLVQKALETLLKEIILPNTPFEIEYSWSGIMGVGKKKSPIVKQLSNHVFCGVRLGGMGVALGSYTAKELAELIG
ncbi:NAD(P)/FAD-dependent oxidoreductase [Polaribacter tangerinus]|uniref:NAD(P)/FAD-dependent oxidoreductase n=1 Tax=Polaribacter tangerinus TaxID=1920034 RepID=UPI000B4B2391|nr:FAD-binding oxidoreductase [Polaribacter tangerinus]